MPPRNDTMHETRDLLTVTTALSGRGNKEETGQYQQTFPYTIGTRNSTLKRVASATSFIPSIMELSFQYTIGTRNSTLKRVASATSFIPSITKLTDKWSVHTD